MTVKQQLEKIKSNRNRIRHLQARKRTLRSDASIHSVDFSGVKVQTSGHGSNVENHVLDSIERMEKLDQEIISATLENDDLCDKIENIDDGGIYAQVLFARYVEDKSIKQIAAELDYDYYYVSSIHSKALKRFAELYPME